MASTEDKVPHTGTEKEEQVKQDSDSACSPLSISQIWTAILEVLKAPT